MRIGKNPYVVRLIDFRQPTEYLKPIIYIALSLTGVALSIYAILFICSMFRYPSLNHFKILSYIWQTLIASAFAISAAIIGVAAILYQTEQSIQAEETRRKRRAKALAATFGLALSALCDYASECANICSGLFTNLKSGSIKHPGIQFPALPPGLIKELSDLIEVSEDDHAKPLITLVRRLQIVNARMADVQRRATGPAGSLLLPMNIIGRTIDAAEIYARAGVLLGYVRRAAPSPSEPITFNDVRRALLVMPTGISNYQVFQDEIDRRFLANGTKSEWPEE